MRYISDLTQDGHEAGPGTEWLLDNLPLIEDQLREITEGLPTRYYRALPTLQGAPWVRLPRIYHLTWSFVAHVDSAFDEDLLTSFLNAYQNGSELRQGELWALPTTLRVVLVENLRRLADRIASQGAARELAVLCAHRIEQLTLEEVQEMQHLMDLRGVERIFLAHLAQILTGHRGVLGGTLNPTMERWLQEAIPDLASLQIQQHADQAADHLSVANAVASLRLIGASDWPSIVAQTSRSMHAMQASPVFAAEDDASRNTTLHGIERLAARCSGQSESSVAQTLIRCMSSARGTGTQAGYWLHGGGREQLERTLGARRRIRDLWHVPSIPRLPIYMGAILAGTLALVAWLLHLSISTPMERSDYASLGLLGLLGLLMLLPASEAVIALVNRLICESVTPAHLPRFLFAEGIPPLAQTMVVIPALLNQRVTVEQLVHRLHLHYLANPEECTQFALLSDWSDADAQGMPADSRLLAHAQGLLKALNAQHPSAHGAPPRFLLLHRARSYSATQRQWIGWERKRGKLEQLIYTLATGIPGPFLDMAELSHMAPGTRYILTLDSDTELPPGQLRALVGVAEHPDNQPRLDSTGRAVMQGYGILQPRVVSSLPQADAQSLWQWLFAGQQGIDPYSAATSDVYQDFFGEGSFIGKGLLNVPAMHAVLGQRLPHDRVLSHDLLEGAMVRCAVVSDLTLVEAAAPHSDTAAARQHRWSRGDWQLLPMLWQHERWGLTPINRWKLLDNLRRTFVAPASLVLIVAAMAGYGLALPMALALAAMAYATGPAVGSLASLLPRRAHVAGARFAIAGAQDLLRASLGGAWHLAQLLSQALLHADAIARTAYRMLWSQQHLLEWTTAESTHASIKAGLLSALARHRTTSLTALALLAGLWLLQAPMAPLTLTALAVWACTPVLVWLFNEPWRYADRPLAPGDRELLEGIARDTWRMFERCVGKDDHHLPPDNLQTAPFETIAHRTSPTNIGLYLLSAACARQFGWIGTKDLLARLEATLATLQGLERHKGHFLNWYDTESLQPLHPLYVSTVDSGNLAAHLLAVSQACVELSRDPLEPHAAQAALRASQRRLEAHSCDASQWIRADQLATMQSAALDVAANAAGEGPRVTQQLLDLAHRLEQLALDADFRFLFHAKRHLLHIGYRVEEQLLDASFYDLLASEARTTSLLAITKGDVPVLHWKALGRPFFAQGRNAVLQSWSGSMFEYLMPTLVIAEPHGSALDEANRSALREQMAFVHGQGIPWGISESAYAGRDQTLAYQYAPQGIPRLALRRTPATEKVIAPYATALACQMAAHAACQNFRALEALSTRGRYGFFEALDFTPGRQAQGERFALVSTYMAHHQGMTIVALANVLRQGAAQRWMMGHPRIEAVSSLLQERAPRELSRLHTPPSLGLPLQALHKHSEHCIRTVIPGAQALEPTHLLSNGRYSVTLRSNGAGWSRWGLADITRWRDDVLRDAYGSFVYLRLGHHTAPVSVTRNPAPDPDALYHSTFQQDRVCFEARWLELRVRTTVWVSPEDDIEFRKVVLNNLGSQTIELDLISAFEVTLASAAADEAHPAFANMFVKAQWLPAQQALHFERVPRLPGESNLRAAHFVAHASGEILGLHYQTDRAQWQGRNHAASQPLAHMKPVPGLAEELVTYLDPVSVLGVRMQIAPGEQVSVTFATAACDSEAKLIAVVDKYRQPSYVERASVMSATLTQGQAAPHKPQADDLPTLQLLTTALVLTLPRAQTQHTVASASDRRVLWPLGISGDRPLILVNAGAPQGAGMLRMLVQTLCAWSRGGVVCDLVVLNSEAHSYHMPVQQELKLLCDQHETDRNARSGSAATGLHVLRPEDITSEQVATLQRLARVRLQADGRPLSHQISAWSGHYAAQSRPLRMEEPAQKVGVQRSRGAATTVPTGTFTAGTGDFLFDAGAGLRPARPWVNILSNPTFGAQVTESGGGNTWAINSRLNQLTAWSNDPVADTPAEWFLLQDRRTLDVWSVAPSAWGEADATYRIVHGQGFTDICHRRGDLDVSVRWCVDIATAVKQVRIRVTNQGAGKAHLRIVGMVEWMMGERRADRATTETEPCFAPPPARGLRGLLCTQTEAGAGFGGGTAFFCEGSSPAGARSQEGLDWTCDRSAFFDTRGQLQLPASLGQRSGYGLDPCAALSRLATLRPGASMEQVYLVGYAASPQAARELLAQASLLPSFEREQAIRQHWNALLSAAQVRTPDPLFDAMVNRWLLYQAQSSRLWAKAGFYQVSGATGYRDQLQDAMAFAWADPHLLRAQILLCASRQFQAGDVQHWWHAPGGAGVRTRFSDDLLWLPFACAHYLRATGDTALLHENVPFLDAPPIPDGEEDAYQTPQVSEISASLYEHAARTMDRSLAVGAHGLPLMGTGDWNDGMNRVGHAGRGESVWLAWFLCAIATDWIPLARSFGDTARAAQWEAALQGWHQALQGPGWDGQWFMRAFFDDGSPLGSVSQSEARIDLIAQAWSVLSTPKWSPRQDIAMDAVEAQLVQPDAGLIQLLAPPLVHAMPNAGYIEAYPPGVRENGGQYTHAGVWALMAAAALAVREPAPPTGEPPATDTPYRYFTYLSPAHRASHPEWGKHYAIEPYVMAGDVYSQPPYVGRGGWSWYTGSAGWMHRAAVESILGLHLQAEELFFTPCLPSHWPEAELTLARDGRSMRFILVRGSPAATLEKEAAADPQVLHVAEPLRWKNLPAHSCFVIPLAPGSTQGRQ
ncbi:glucoamylase family protein [Comamonas humi]